MSVESSLEKCPACGHICNYISGYCGCKCSYCCPEILRDDETPYLTTPSWVVPIQSLETGF